MRHHNYEMHNVIGVNLFLRKFLRMETDNSVPTPLLNGELHGCGPLPVASLREALLGPSFS